MIKFLLNLPFLKRCYDCKSILPLILFKKDSRKYKRESNKGKVFCCRVCRVKQIRKEGNRGMVWNGSKFETKDFSTEDIVKEFFTW